MKQDNAAGEDLALFHDLLEGSENPVLVLGEGLAVRHANKAAARLFHPAGAPDAPRNLAEFCGAGCLYFCELVAAAVHNGEPLRSRDVSIAGDAFSLSMHRGKAAWIVTLRPVTRELSLEYRAKQLLRHRDTLLHAMDGIEGSVIIVDTAGSIRYMNRFTRKFVGDLMNGVPIAEWPSAAGFYRPDGVTLLEGPHRIFPRALNGQTVIDEAMVVKNEITGEALDVQASATPVYDRKGRIESAIGWFHHVGPHRPQLKDANILEIDPERE